MSIVEVIDLKYHTLLSQEYGVTDNRLVMNSENGSVTFRASPSIPIDDDVYENTLEDVELLTEIEVANEGELNKPLIKRILNSQAKRLFGDKLVPPSAAKDELALESVERIVDAYLPNVVEALSGQIVVGSKDLQSCLSSQRNVATIVSNLSRAMFGEIDSLTDVLNDNDLKLSDLRTSVDYDKFASIIPGKEILDKVYAVQTLPSSKLTKSITTIELALLYGKLSKDHFNIITDTKDSIVAMVKDTLYDLPNSDNSNLKSILEERAVRCTTGVQHEMEGLFDTLGGVFTTTSQNGEELIKSIIDNAHIVKGAYSGEDAVEYLVASATDLKTKFDSISIDEPVDLEVVFESLAVVRSLKVVSKEDKELEALLDQLLSAVASALNNVVNLITLDLIVKSSLIKLTSLSSLAKVYEYVNAD